MDSIPGITAAATPTATSTSTPGAPSAPAKAPALPLEIIMQREQTYYGQIDRRLKQEIVAAKLDTSETRFQALGQQLLYITSPCAIGKTPLEAFIAQHPEAVERGQAVMANLPAPGDEKFFVGKLAYQALLANASVLDQPAEPTISLHSAVFLTRSTDTSTPTP
ncbi:TPA: hypothetical protein QDZ10_001054 [Stenotrophomonas maltophilia]|nr:hypothetical protein [Stenotrophomonas maltophilia]